MVGAAYETDLACVRLHDAARDRQAQASNGLLPTALPAKEALEEAHLLVRGDARARILHGEPLLAASRLDEELNRGAMRTEPRRVVEQVRQRQDHVLAVGLDQRPRLDSRYAQLLLAALQGGCDPLFRCLEDR